MQVIGDLAADLALHADAVLASIAQGRQRVVATLFAAVQQQAQADVLAGLECRQRATVGRHQVQRNDLLTFLHLAAQAETARPAPATLGSGVGAIRGLFGTDEDVRQLPIRHGPGLDHRIGGNLRTEHFTNRPQQAAADNRVMLGQDLQRHMLVDDLPNQRPQRLQPVDMPGVHQHRIGQGTLLAAAGLVRLIEQRAHIGVLAQHHLVEVPSQGFTAAFQQRYGGFDQGVLGGGQHRASSSGRHAALAQRFGSYHPDYYRKRANYF